MRWRPKSGLLTEDIDFAGGMIAVLDATSKVPASRGGGSLSSNLGSGESLKFGAGSRMPPWEGQTGHEGGILVMNERFRTTNAAGSIL
jgi:hypothetical protein